MIDVITGIAKQNHSSTTSCSLLMFMSMTYSSKVILQMTSEGSPIASGPTYRSFDKIRRDNQGRAHVKITHRWSSAMDHDQKPQYQRLPSSTTLWPRSTGCPRFYRGTIVATHNTITDHTTKVKFQVAQIGLYEQALCKGEIASKGSHKVRSQQGVVQGKDMAQEKHRLANEDN